MEINKILKQKKKKMNTITFERKIKEKEIETITFCLCTPEIYKTRK